MPRPQTAQPNDSVLCRRDFLRSTAGALALGALAQPCLGLSESPPAAESLVKVLHEGLSPTQRKAICFPWDHVSKKQGILRTYINPNWHVTKPSINSEFYTADQQHLIRQIFEAMIEPEWHERIDRQLKDDAGGFGNDQNIAIFGEPGSNQFELVMTGRHLTLRCDGNTTEHVAFGGPIFYGHAAEGFNESAQHKGNIYWPQAIAANQVFTMLDGKQRAQALVKELPEESQVPFRGPQGKLPGIPLSELSGDQKQLMEEVLQKLLAPYRAVDREEVRACLAAQGGWDRCALAFYAEGDVGDDQVWDCWRLEGPSLVWYFRGDPHVHVWVNVADRPDIPLNS